MFSSSVALGAGVCAFAALWCGLCWMLSWVSGWQGLARRFRCRTKPPCAVSWLERGELNSVRYNGVLIVGACEEGLYLAVWPLFRLGHTPLLIPWNELNTFKASKQFWRSLYTTRIPLSRFHCVTLAFYDRSTLERVQSFLPPEKRVVLG